MTSRSEFEELEQAVTEIVQLLSKSAKQTLANCEQIGSLIEQDGRLVDIIKGHEEIQDNLLKSYEALLARVERLERRMNTITN